MGKIVHWPRTNQWTATPQPYSLLGLNSVQVQKGKFNSQND